MILHRCELRSNKTLYVSIFIEQHRIPSHTLNANTAKIMADWLSQAIVVTNAETAHQKR